MNITLKTDGSSLDHLGFNLRHFNSSMTSSGIDLAGHLSFWQTTMAYKMTAKWYLYFFFFIQLTQNKYIFLTHEKYTFRSPSLDS